MTLDEVIGRVEEDRPGEAEKGEMVRWLSQLDARWQTEVIDTHERGPDDHRRPYNHFIHRKETIRFDRPPVRVLERRDGQADFSKAPEERERAEHPPEGEDRYPVEPPFGEVGGRFSGYSRDFDGARMLLIPPPYDEVYVYYLYAQTDQRLGEIERYNNDAALFNNAWAEAVRWYNRNHMPLNVKVHHVVYGAAPRRHDPEDVFW